MLRRTRKRDDKPLSHETINKTLTRLGQVPGRAKRYGYIAQNPVHERGVKLFFLLREVLTEQEGGEDATPRRACLPDRGGEQHSQSNIRTRGSHAWGSASLKAVGVGPLPELTPQSLRRTFASILY